MRGFESLGAIFTHSARPPKCGISDADWCEEDRVESVAGVRVYLGSRMRLRDLPDTGSCPECGGTSQRELMRYTAGTAQVQVIAESVPGYGCKDCPSKTFNPLVHAALMRAAAGILDQWGVEERLQASDLRNRSEAFRQAISRPAEAE